MTLEQTREVLIAARQAKQPNQRNFAKMSGQNHCVVSELEKGRRLFSYKSAEKYAKALGYEISIKLTNQETGEVIE